MLAQLVVVIVIVIVVIDEVVVGIPNNLGVGLGCRGTVQWLPGRCAKEQKESQLLILGLEFDN